MTTTTAEPAWLTAREACAAAKVSRVTLGRWMRAGLPAYRPHGGRVLISLADLDRWVRSAPQGSRPPTVRRAVR